MPPTTRPSTESNAIMMATMRVRSGQPAGPRRRDGREEVEAAELMDQSAGLSTYPAPRMVWIIGARPASIFFRRYEM
ncbi:hypothetical protein GCM10010109_82540 [Actinoplanes campanulatus]|nr:hypothetical protein GCM10010109_82540 [Actinoplanes campanulatus]